MKKLLLPLALFVMGYLAGSFKCHSLNFINFGPKTSISIAIIWFLFSALWLFLVFVVDDLAKEDQADQLFNPKQDN